MTERYDPVKNTWETIQVANAPQLAAFSWTKLSDEKLMILGGTDGDLLQEDVYTIDFKSKTSEPFGYVGTQSAMGKLVFRAEKNHLYHFGGYGSGG